MFKINLTGADETVRLSENAGLVCAPRDIEMLAETLRDVQDKAEESSVNALTVAVAKAVIRDWFGLFDEDGAEIKFDADLIPAVMSDPVVLQAFRHQYFDRLLYLREEGNGSSPSRNGTTGADKGTAKAAPKTARRAPTGKKGRTAPKGATSGG